MNMARLNRTGMGVGGLVWLRSGNLLRAPQCFSGDPGFGTTAYDTFKYYYLSSLNIVK